MPENNLDRIYEEFGSNICLFPFFAAFYQSHTMVNPTDSNVNNNSTIRPCSVYNYSPSKNENLVINNSILETINSIHWKDLRKNFLENSCHTWKGCEKCSNAEQRNGDSPRQLNNQYFVEHLTVNIKDELKNIINKEYQVTQVLSLEFFPSNYCNYECVMCSGGSSTSRLAFENRNYPKQLQKLFKIQINPLADDFYKVLHSVEILNFAGGETIQQKQVHEVIEYLVDNNLADKIIISLLTNASSYPIKFLKNFAKFKEVFYTISIDGVDDVIEYQRRGANWVEVNENAIKIYKSFGAVINYVLTAINVFSFTDFLDWAVDNSIDKLVISYVFNIEELSVQVIPPDLKKDLITKLNVSSTRYSGVYLQILTQVIEILNRSTFQPKLLPLFIDHIKNEDNVSKFTLGEVVPEWKPYFV